MAGRAGGHCIADFIAGIVCRFCQRYCRWSPDSIGIAHELGGEGIASCRVAGDLAEIIAGIVAISLEMGRPGHVSLGPCSAFMPSLSGCATGIARREL